MAWARGGCVGAKGASPEIGDGRWEIGGVHSSGESMVMVSRSMEKPSGR